MAEVDELKIKIRSVLLSSKDGVKMLNFPSEYTQLTGEKIDVKQLGFKTVDDFLGSISDTVTCRGGSYFAVSCDSTDHLEKLIQQQKSNHKPKPVGLPNRLSFGRQKNSHYQNDKRPYHNNHPSHRYHRGAAVNTNKESMVETRQGRHVLPDHYKNQQRMICNGNNINQPFIKKAISVSTTPSTALSTTAATWENIPATTAIVNTVRIKVMSILWQATNGLHVSALQRKYRSLTGKHIPLREHGYKSVGELMYNFVWDNKKCVNSGDVYLAIACGYSSNNSDNNNAENNCSYNNNSSSSIGMHSQQKPLPLKNSNTLLMSEQRRDASLPPSSLPSYSSEQNNNCHRRSNVVPSRINKNIQYQNDNFNDHGVNSYQRVPYHYKDSEEVSDKDYMSNPSYCSRHTGPEIADYRSRRGAIGRGHHISETRHSVNSICYKRDKFPCSNHEEVSHNFPKKFDQDSAFNSDNRNHGGIGGRFSVDDGSSNNEMTRSVTVIEDWKHGSKLTFQHGSLSMQGLRISFTNTHIGDPDNHCTTGKSNRGQSLNMCATEDFDDNDYQVRDQTVVDNDTCEVRNNEHLYHNIEPSSNLKVVVKTKPYQSDRYHNKRL